jgi:ATP-dependent DNA helicase RecG
VAPESAPESPVLSVSPDESASALPTAEPQAEPGAKPGSEALSADDALVPGFRLAAVTRSLEWAAADPARLAESRHLGTSCARFVASVASAVPPELSKTLDGLQAGLVALDALEPGERGRSVVALLAHANALAPLSTAGARDAILDTPGGLLLPRGRRRRRGRDDASARPTDGAASSSGAATTGVTTGVAPAGEAAGTAGSGDASAAAGSAVEGGEPTKDASAADAAPARRGSSKREPSPSDSPSTKGRSGRRGRKRGDETARDAASSDGGRRRKGTNKAAASTSPKPPPAPVRPLGHPSATGRPLADLDGANVEVVAKLQALGIHTIADLLTTPPTGHVRHANYREGAVAEGPDFTAADNTVADGVDAESASSGASSGGSAGVVTVRGKVQQRFTLLAPMGRRRMVVVEVAENMLVTARWLGEGAPRGWDSWVAGSEVALVGVVADTDDGLVLYEGEPVGIDGRGSGFLPQYELEGCDDHDVRELVGRGLDGILSRLADPVPSGIRSHHRLLTLDQALRDAHFPANAAGRGRVRLAFEELLLMQLGVAWRSGRGRPERGLAHKVLHSAVGQIGAQHNLTLDDGQEMAFAEIRRDLHKSRPMARLLQGDVGAGKGMVCLMSALVVVGNGHQVAMVAPDALAAERRFLHVESLLRSVGVAPLLVGDRVNHAQADAIRRGEAQVVFGTSAVLADSLAWKRLGLVVVEERSPYGVITSGTVGSSQGPRPDLLVTTRVPIPSSLTFTVFGDLDVSVVRQTNRPRVSSSVLTATARKDAYTQVRAAIAAGQQAFVVLPVREGRDLLNHADAKRMAAALHADALRGARVGVYSTDMTREERSRVFDDFQHRRIDALVCTTYIEDAPPVANASVMLVEYADLHDLMRLHRLRGHVGGGHTEGTCFFVLSDQPADKTPEQVAMVVRETDGFALAEIDLDVRGAAALLGDRATEMPTFRWANPPRDRELLLRARQEAFRIVADGGGMRRSPELAQAVSARWSDWLGQHPTEELPPPPTTAAPTEERTGRRRRRRRKR